MLFLGGKPECADPKLLHLLVTVYTALIEIICQILFDFSVINYLTAIKIRERRLVRFNYSAPSSILWRRLAAAEVINTIDKYTGESSLS
jgi:hypothetical protein